MALAGAGRPWTGRGRHRPCGGELEPVVALRALGTAPGGDRGDTGRGQARPVRPAGGLGGAGENLAADLAGRLGMHWCWAEAAHARDDGRRGAVHRQRDPQPLADHRARADRPAGRRPGGRGQGGGARPHRHPGRCAADVHHPPDLRAGPVAGAHGAGPHAGPVRRRTRRGCAYPPVVTGDLNAEPGSDEMRLLGGLLTAPAAPDWCSSTPGGTPTR